jgi:hypothetical protein
MLEVEITECGPTEWEWRVWQVGRPCIDAGWQKTRADAKRQAEGALFHLLVTGWKTRSIGLGIRRGH